MLNNEQIARAFLREARSDWNAAGILRTAGEYARSILHSQQTVEKAIKAVLAARSIIITGRHRVSADFAANCADLADHTRITRIGARLERIGSRSEYPLFGDPNRPVWIPSEQLGDADALQALDEATFVFDTLARHLADAHGITL